MCIIYRDFKNTFGEIFGDKLKSHPRGYDKNFKDIDLIKHMHYAVLKKINNDFRFNTNLHDNISKVIKAQYEFNKYLNTIIKNQMEISGLNKLSAKKEEEFIKNNFGL